jgi:N-carbamoylputrescine amidase
VTRVALAQVSGPPDGGAANLARSLQVARELFSQGAQVVVLPELIVPGYGWDAGLIGSLAEPLEGETVTAWSALAREFDGYLAGGFAERDGDHIYNAAVLVGREGIVLHYRKLHLFAREKDVFAPGDRGLPVASTPHGRIGICVCYDLRFVETLRILALRDAELVCVPTAWVAGFDEERWDAGGLAPQARGVLLQANLDQVFVACASQAGEHGGPIFLGSSLVADPRGRCVLGPLAGDREDAAIAELDLGEVVLARDRGNGVLPRDDRRTDVYALEVDGQRL